MTGLDLWNKLEGIPKDQLAGMPVFLATDEEGNDFKELDGFSFGTPHENGVDLDRGVRQLSDEEKIIVLWPEA